MGYWLPAPSAVRERDDAKIIHQQRVRRLEAARRVWFKRRLRLAGVPFGVDAPTADLVRLWLMVTK